MFFLFFCSFLISFFRNKNAQYEKQNRIRSVMVSNLDSPCNDLGLIPGSGGAAGIRVYYCPLWVQNVPGFSEIAWILDSCSQSFFANFLVTLWSYIMIFFRLLLKPNKSISFILSPLIFTAVEFSSHPRCPSLFSISISMCVSSLRVHI